MRITALARGGLSVYGGHYDPHRNEAIVQARTGETVGVTIEYPSAPSAASADASGMSASAPAVSGVKLTTALTDITDGAYADITATVSGEIRIIRIRAANADAQTDYGCGLV